jgi:pimeloyl-ACP methyl ester carboxylesterase
METVRSKDGTRIAFDRYGEGPPVILVGGAFSYRAFGKMVQLAELLSPRFTSVNYDRRGRGDSGDSPAYEVEREIEDLEAVMEAVGGSASVWGWSSGGVLALRAAGRGLDIRRVAVYEPPFMVEPSKLVPPPDFAARLQELVDAGRRSAAVRFYMTKGMGVPSLFVTFMRFTPFWSKLKATSPTLPYEWAVLGDAMSGKPLSAEEWASVSVPTLVISGEKSPEPLRKAARALEVVLPNGEHRELKGQSHNPSMKAMAPVLEKFFSDAAMPTVTNSTKRVTD